MRHLYSGFDRRQFLKQATMAGVAAVATSKASGTSRSSNQANSSGHAAASSAHKPAFRMLPLGAIRPAGWLKSQLQVQADGLSGHLDETWPDVGPDSGWLGGAGESWERGPYYLDGLLPLAYLLNDERLKAKAHRFVEWTLASQREDGMFGPKSNDDWWPRMVMLKALSQFQETTSDPRVVPFLAKYFQYQLAALPKRPLTSWGRFRWQDEALAALWLYDRNGDQTLLELVNLLRSQGYDWIAQYNAFPYREKMTQERLDRLAEVPASRDVKMATHGVNNAQAIKTGAVWSRISGEGADRQAVAKMISILDEYHGLPNGMFSCDEHLAGKSPSQGSELCTVVEYMFSLEQSLAILGDAALGDRLEKLAFNALPGTMTDDMWAHQYDQQPNQVECSLHKAPWSTNGPESNLYGLEPHFGCCTANFSQGWPKFAASLFMGTDDGLVAAAYSPCEVHTVVRGVNVHILEETEYPFRESVKMTVSPARPTRFVMLLRVPAWAAGAEVRVNGQQQGGVVPGQFARLEREWKPGDLIELHLPMQTRLIAGFNDSVSVERGPLVFAYNIGQDWLKLRDRGMTADWQVYPSSRWNYALVADELQGKKLSVTENPVLAHPFTAAATPVQIHVDARLVPSWFASEGVAEPVPKSPVQTSEKIESITLIPYAAAKLRITAFPRCASPSASS